MLKGDLSVNASITSSSAVHEFLIKNSNGGIVTKVNGATGDMEVKSSFQDGVSSLTTTSAKEFVIKNGSDTGSSAQIIISETGALRVGKNIVDP